MLSGKKKENQAVKFTQILENRKNFPHSLLHMLALQDSVSKCVKQQENAKRKL